MGKMKELFIQLQQQERGMPDDTDWDAPSYDSAGFTIADRNPLDPPPDEVNLESQLCMWVIKDCRIWARNYQDAINIFDLI